MKVSGLTVPRDMRWMRSSPTAAAAFRPESTSPGSRRLRSWVEWPQTPAKQSACSSRATESWLAAPGFCCCACAHLGLDAQQLLHVMSDFVGQHVGFGEFSGGAEALLQFVVEAEIDINFFVLGTVERSGRGLCHPAGGIVGVTKQDQLGMAVGCSLLRQDLAPGILGVVQDKGHELHQRLLLLVARGIGLRGCGARVHGAVAHQREKITFEDQAQNKQDDDAAQAEVNASGAKRRLRFRSGGLLRRHCCHLGSSACLLPTWFSGGLALGCHCAGRASRRVSVFLDL